jgi:hypothetical protein
MAKPGRIPFIDGSNKPEILEKRVREYLLPWKGT